MSEKSDDPFALRPSGGRERQPALQKNICESLHSIFSTLSRSALVHFSSTVISRGITKTTHDIQNAARSQGSQRAAGGL